MIWPRVKEGKGGYHQEDDNYEVQGKRRISPLAVPSAHVRTAGGERSWHTKLIAGRRGRYGNAERTLAIAHLCVV